MCSLSSADTHYDVAIFEVDKSFEIQKNECVENKT